MIYKMLDYNTDFVLGIIKTEASEPDIMHTISFLNDLDKDSLKNLVYVLNILGYPSEIIEVGTLWM